MPTPSKYGSAPTALYPSLVALFESGQYAKLESRARSVVKQHDGFGPAWKLLALALRIQGRNELPAWRRAAELLPDDPEVHYRLGDTYRDLGQMAEAAMCYRRVLEISPEEFGAHLNLGMIHHGMGRLGEAELAYRQARRIKPDLTEAFYNLALLFKQQGRFDEAATDFSHVIELRPDFVEAHNNLGIAFAALGRKSDAEATFRRALLLRPDHLATLFSLGMLVFEQGRSGEAEMVFRRLLEINPQLAEVQFRLGATLYSLGRLNEAETAYRQALRINPDFPEAHCGLGTTLLRIGRQGESEACYRNALRLRPDFPELHHQIGSLLKNLGRGDEALVHLGLALKGRGDWKERLIRLADPFVLLDGLILSGGDTSPLPLETGGPPITTQPVQAVTTWRRIPASASRNVPTGISKRERVVLIYPPPWKIPSPGNTGNGEPLGPPRDGADHELDSDFATIPYGLLTIAAEARRAGHEVKVFNFSTTSWREVESAITEATADVFGISAFTSNRRGMGAVAELIRKQHPHAHITVGGPFVTALPKETLKHFPDIDTAVIGEGEETFMELLESLAAGQPTIGIPGTAWRAGDEIITGPTRQRIRNLDDLASPFDYFSNYIVMTSRGCPSQCSFCGSFVTWGKKLRFHSVESCVEIFKKALSRLPVPFIAVKDDTFTAHRRRAIAICDAIIKDRMNFLWSCDTRIDSLDEELLYKMRLAGCQRISLGVESGAPEILDSIHKETTPEAAVEITRLARKFGINVRYYMILGNRGETPKTVQQSIDLVRAGRPSFVTFCLLGFCPGTEEWELLRQKYGVTPDLFFANDFKELTVATNRRGEWDSLLTQIQCEIGSFGFDFTVDEREAVVQRMPDLPSVHADLANAYFKAGRLDDADAALARAETLSFPIPGVIDNQRACIALARDDVGGALNLLDRALRHAAHPLIKINRQNLLTWTNTPAELRGDPPVLNDSVQAHDFQLYHQTDALSGGAVS